MDDGKLVLVKHAQPILEEEVPPRDWMLGDLGAAQARGLAGRLESFRPIVLLSSFEPKARRTAEILAAELDIPCRPAPGFEELDRRILPIVTPEEHERLNEPIFNDLNRATVGNETGNAALERFSTAVDREVAGLAARSNLVVVCHGTVIALFVAAHNDVNARDLWRRLKCTSFVVLRLPGFGLLELGDGEAREAGG